MTNKSKKIEDGLTSLSEIMGRVGPFVPKPPKVERKEQKKWEFHRSGELPPIYSLKCW